MNNEFFQEEDVLPYMAGMWREALQAICAVESRYFNGKHQDCPSCGGKDRFRWTDKLETKGDGGAYCGGCGADKGIGWLMKLTGEPYSECINILGRFLGKQPVEYVRKANKRASRDPGYSYGKMTDHEKIEAIMSRTVKLTETFLSRFEGFVGESFDVGVKTRQDGAEEQFHALPMLLVHEDGLSDEYCNLLFIDSDANEKYLAGDLTFGAVIPTNQDSSGTIYLTCSWIDAQHIAAATGCEVWACGLPTNLEIVAYRYKGDREMRVACKRSDYEMLCMADERGLKVIVPNGDNYKMGMERKLYDAESLIG